MQCLTTIENDYQAAKMRLLNAQQEKLEATAEFLSARAALGQMLETLWPVRCECGEKLGDRENIYEQRIK